MSTKPIIKWVGGKTQLLNTINDNLPQDLNQFNTYIEPFIGGASVLFDIIPKLPNIKNVFVNDLNYKLTNLYSVIKNKHLKLIEQLNIIQESYRNSLDPKLFYYNMRDSFNVYDMKSQSNSDVLHAAEFIFLNKTCFNGLYRENSKGEFNVPWNKNTNVCICDEENIKEVHNFFIKYNINICTGTYNDFLKSCESCIKNAFVYMDPPYRPITKSSAFTAYTKSGFNDDNQKDLKKWFDILTDKNAYCMLSNSDPKNSDINDMFFDDLYSDYNIIRVNAKRSINSKGTGRGNITEILVMNYELNK